MSQKLIVNDGRTEREMLLVGTLVVGRDPACDISAIDPLLSRRHVEFIAGASGATVRDLGSRNGILVNGVKVTHGNLRTGDAIQVGHLQVTFVEDNSPLAVPAAEPELEATLPSRPAPAQGRDDFDRTLPAVPKPDVARVAGHVPRKEAPPSAADFDVLDRTIAPKEARPSAPTLGDLDRTIAPIRKTDPPAAQEFGRAPLLEMQPFVGLGDRIRFDFPKKDWQLISGGAVALVTLAQQSGQAAVVVEHTQLNKTLEPEDITDRFAQVEADAVKQRQSAAGDVQAKLLAVDGRRLVIVTYTRRGVAGPERVRQYSIPAGSDLYRLTCSAATTQFARYEPVFAHVAASFATPGRTD